MILIVNLVMTAIMVGLTLFVLVVHYPLLKEIKTAADFLSYHDNHMRLAGLLIAPLMVLELGLGIYLVYMSSSILSILALILLVLVWLVTFLWSVPKHSLLAEDGFSVPVHKSLMLSHLTRSLCWISRLVILVALLPK